MWRPLLAAGVLACILSCLHAGAAPRNRTSFDFSWRFVLGNPVPPSCSFQPLAGVECMQLSPQAAATTPAQCEAACCAQGEACGVWQFSPAKLGCWVGGSCASSQPSTAWMGGARNASVPTNCTPGTPCDPNYDDSTWRALDVPHDYVIEGTFNHGVCLSVCVTLRTCVSGYG